MEATKVDGNGPVQVQQPSQSIEKHSTKNPTTQKATKEKPKHNQNKQHTQTKLTDNLENDRRPVQELVTNVVPGCMGLKFIGSYKLFVVS
jgi:hypothetical protein